MQVARQLVGRVSNDLEARLHGVLSALDIMHTRIGEEEPRDLGPLLDAAVSSLHQAAILSRKLMAVSRPKKSEVGPVSVNAILAGMSVLLRSMAGFTIDIEIDLGKNLPNVFCDPGHLETVLFNLALDARHAIIGAGKIIIETRSNVVRAEPQHVFLQICVVDTGDVDPATSGARLLAWEANTTPQPDRRASVEMARHFAAGLRGRVVVDRHPDSGTSITVLLPIQHEDYGSRNPATKPDQERTIVPEELGQVPLYSVIPPSSHFACRIDRA